MIIMSKKCYKVGLLLIVLGLCPILWKFFEIDWKIGLAVAVLWFLVRKNKFVLVLAVPILFLINLNLNHFFTIKFKPLEYSFDLEKMVIADHKNLEMVQIYQKNGMVVPYRLRKISFGKWLVLRLWVMNILKIISPVYLIRTIGIFGFLALFLAKPKRQEMIWIMTVIASSALGTLVDTKTSVVLILPVLLFWWRRGIKQLSIRQLRITNLKK